jgi:hypothetical protein
VQCCRCCCCFETPDTFTVASYILNIYESSTPEPGQEFTLAQSALHRDFCDLFESFCEGYLEKEGFNIDQFYNIVRKYIKDREVSVSSNHSQKKAESKEEAKMNANEIMMMIQEVSDFELWATRMTERCNERRQFREEYGKL